MEQNNRIFTKFQRHTDNGSEIISANDINKIQTSTNTAQEDINDLKDYSFNDELMDKFNNNLFVNSLFADNYNNLGNINLTKSSNYIYDSYTKTITIDDINKQCILLSNKIESTLDKNSKVLNDFFMYAQYNNPLGSYIRFYIIDEDSNEYPLDNNPTFPVHLTNNIKYCYLKCVLGTNTSNKPKLNTVSLMFFDESLEKQYGILIPEQSRYSTTVAGLTILYRDRAMNDRLFKIEEPGGVTTLLNYDATGRLVNVKRIDKAEIITDILNYGDYLNSQNENEEVLLTIKTICKNDV